MGLRLSRVSRLDSGVLLLWWWSTRWSQRQQQGETYVLTGASRRRPQLLQIFANHNLTNCVIKLQYDVILYLSRAFTSQVCRMVQYSRFNCRFRVWYHIATAEFSFCNWRGLPWMSSALHVVWLQHGRRWRWSESFVALPECQMPERRGIGHRSKEIVLTSSLHSAPFSQWYFLEFFGFLWDFLPVVVLLSTRKLTRCRCESVEFTQLHWIATLRLRCSSSSGSKVRGDQTSQCYLGKWTCMRCGRIWIIS